MFRANLHLTKLDMLSRNSTLKLLYIYKYVKIPRVVIIVELVVDLKNKEL